MTTRVLVASIGNPAPYANTLHSAGHTVLDALRELLDYPAFTKSKDYGGGFISQGDDFTLWKSPLLMNTSGKAVNAAYKHFKSILPSGDTSAARLVVVHDELESELGKLRMKSQGSPKGHNGLKSCIQSLGGPNFLRLGVGIGRPESRDSKVVADYVLRKMTTMEKNKISGGAEGVLSLLQAIE